MAVQQNKKSPSRRNMRRSHDGIGQKEISTDSTNGDRHRRHHISANGYYRGKQVIATAAVEDTAE